MTMQMMGWESVRPGWAGQKEAELLALIADGKKVPSISALSRRAGLSRYKTVRLLLSLERRGLVTWGADSCRLPPGWGGGGAQQPAPGSSPAVRGTASREEAIRQALMKDARPMMESLARRHNEAVYLTIMNGDEVLFLDLVESRRRAKGEPLVGRRYPFFTNAAGKVMRAIDSWDLLEKIGKRWRGGGGRYPDLAGLRAELELVRARGVAVDCGGMGEGIITVAVAVRDYAGKVIGALTMLGPSVRLLGERLEEEIIPSLRVSGELLSMKFGYARPG